MPHSGVFDFFFSLFFLGLHLQHMDILRLETESEQWLLFSNTAIAMQNLGRICEPCCSLWQFMILNPLSREQIEPESSWILCQVLTSLRHNGNSHSHSFLFLCMFCNFFLETELLKYSAATLEIRFSSILKFFCCCLLHYFCILFVSFLN